MFRQIHPGPATTDPATLLASAGLPQRAPGERSYAVACMVASADGRASIAGRSGPLGDDGDREMFHALREAADAIVVGTSTAARERYGRVLDEDERRARRLTSGRPAEPLLCLLSRSGSLPLDLPILAHSEAEVLIVTAGPVTGLDGAAARVRVVRASSPSTIGFEALAILRREHGVRLAVCEGGPRVLTSLLAEQVLDELFLTVAPTLAGGGEEPAITSGPPLPIPAQLGLEWALERRGSLYLRYRVR